MSSSQAPPVIDISSLASDSGSRARTDTIAAIAEASTDWGAFQVLGHGVPQPLLADFLAQMRGFFALPDAERQAILRTAENPFGYYDRELTKNQPDWKQVFDCASERVGAGDPFAAEDLRESERGGLRPADRNQWPASLPEFKTTVLAYIDECERVSLSLLRALCQSLELPVDFLDPAFVGLHTSFLRLNHYPPCDEPAPADTALFPERGHLGVHHHTDAGALTIVFQDEVDGLQIQHDGRWHLIDVAPGALVVHLADMLQVWTNDRYRSPVHRVLANSRSSRYSAPYFFNPSYATDCRPLPGLCDEPARYRPVNWGEFRRLRTDGDYANYGEEVQISQYRIG